MFRDTARYRALSLMGDFGGREISAPNGEAHKRGE